MAFLGARFVSLLLLGSQALTTATAIPATDSEPHAVWPRQYADPEAPPPSVEACIDRSFSNPNWHVISPMLVTVNGSRGGTTGDLQFLAINMATGVTARCNQSNIELDPRGPDALTKWHGCNVTDLGFQFNLTSFEMRLRGSWVCEKGSPLVFSANGTWEEPLIQGCLDDDEAPRGEEILCIMGNSQVSGSLSTPVAIAPQLPLIPYVPAEPYHRCVDRSWDPEWVVEQFSFRHHASQGLDGVAGKKFYELSLNLTNASNGETVPCSVTVDEQTSATARGTWPWVKCAAPANATSLISQTEVMLDPDYGVLGVQQTWNCTDGIAGIDAGKYTGTAYLSSSLACTTPRTTNQYDTKGNLVGSTTDYSCSLGIATPDAPIRFSGYMPEAPNMPHTSYSRSCTIGSFINVTSLSLKEYQLETTDSSTVGTFAIANPGSGDTYRLSKLAVVDDGAWHECVAGVGNLPWQLVGCQYLVDRKARRIGFRVKWYCDDRDPSHAVLFEATATTTLPKEKCEKATGTTKRELCTLPAEVGELKIPVTNLTWKASSGPMDRGPILPWI